MRTRQICKGTLNQIPRAELKSLRLGNFQHFAKRFVESLCVFECSQRAAAPTHLKRCFAIRVDRPGHSNIDVRFSSGASPKRVRETSIHFSTELTLERFHSGPRR